MRFSTDPMQQMHRFQPVFSTSTERLQAGGGFLVPLQRIARMVRPVLALLALIVAVPQSAWSFTPGTFNVPVSGLFTQINASQTPISATGGGFTFTDVTNATGALNNPSYNRINFLCSGSSLVYPGYVGFKSDDGTAFKLMSINMVAGTLQWATPNTLTMTGYKGGSAVSGATATKSDFPTDTGTTQYTWDVSSIAAFGNVDEIRITTNYSGSTAGGRLSLYQIVTQAAVQPAVAPTVTTSTSASITSTTATLGGNATSDGGATITERGVVYSPTATNSNPLINGTGVLKATTTGTTGVFTVPVSSLTAATGYSYKAYATNSVGTSYSPVSTFTTLAPAPTVTTNAATSVTPTGAVLNGSVNANGASTTVTFNYGPTNTYGFSITAAQSPVTGSSATPVSAALSGLVPGATYHYQAVGVNSGGTVLGTDQTFTVLAGVDYDFESIASSTISFSSSGKTWGLTGQFTGVTVGGGAPAAGVSTPESGAYIDTGYGRAMSLGDVGGIQAPPGYTFRAASFDILPSDAAGNNGQYTIGNTTQANAVLTGVGTTYQVIGKKGGTQVCSATVADTARTPADSDTSNSGGFWHHIDLTGTAFATTDIDDIEFVLIAQTNVNDPVTYIALDNFTYSSLTALPPTVTALGTSTGTTAGGTSVAITGTNFTGATAVVFGSTSATGFTVNSATQITATAPAGSAGTVDVTVTTPGGTSATSAADQFTYVAPPTITSISSTKGNGSYNATVLVPITVTFSAAVTVTGVPTLALNSGGSASFASGSGTATLTFNYTVGATDNATLLDCSSTTALALAGGTINATTGGTAATLTLPTPGGANSLGVNKAIVIDTTPPTIVSINRLTPTGQTTASNTVTFRVTYSEAVTVPGTTNFTVVAVNGSTIVGTVTGVTGTGTTRDVTVSITSGTGEFRLRGVN